MPACLGILGNHSQCARLQPEGTPRCGQHAAVHNRRVVLRGEPLAGRCLMWIGNTTTGHWCARNAANGNIKCQWHIDIHARRDQVAVFLAAFLQQEPRPHWHDVARAVQRAPEMNHNTRFRVASAYQLEMAPNVAADEFVQFYNWAVAIEAGINQPAPVAAPQVPPQVPPAPARPPANVQPTLADIAADNQSVHTTAVSDQTNIGLQKLLNTPVPARQRTLETFAFLWLRFENATWGEVANLVDDMHIWYVKKMCRKPNDQLYKKVLDGLLAYIMKIQSIETKSELMMRVYQECMDAKGMCCDGHISRLCNVLVGFDPDFAAPVSKGEILQNKIAAIAAMEASGTEKVKRAMEVFRELSVPADDWGVWIDALVED